MLIYERDLVKPDPGPRQRAFGVPSTRIAEAQGRSIVQNIVMVGFFAAATRIVPRDASVSEGCIECHRPMFEGTQLTDFSHAVGRQIDGRGEITCATCHNPHGPLESSRCLDCHSQEPAALAQQSEKARRYHQVAAERGTECMRCHKGLAHPITPLATTVPSGPYSPGASAR